MTLQMGICISSDANTGLCSKAGVTAKPRVVTLDPFSYVPVDSSVKGRLKLLSIITTEPKARAHTQVGRVGVGLEL